MRIKPFASLACALTAGALILPACGGGEEPDPAAEFAPADDLRVLEQRVGGLERQLRDLRQAIKSQGDGKQSSTDEPGDEAATDAAADQGGASTPKAVASGASDASGSDAAGGRGSASGGGSGSGGGSRGGSGGGSDGGSDAGGGPDPGTREDDPSIEDICGPNPAPEC